MTLQIVPAETGHAGHLGDNLRAGDWAELKGMGYTSGLEAVLACLEDCPDSVTCLEDGVPIAAWGYKADASILFSTAYLWCMTTPAVERHKKSILRFSKQFVEALNERFYRLETTTSPIYPQSVRWVAWLGFKPVSRIMMNNVEFVTIQRLRGA